VKSTGNLGLGGIGLAGVVAIGALTAVVLPAQAESTPSSVATPGSTTDSSTGGHTATGVTETVLTGDVAAKVEAAVKAAYPDATIERMENDADGATYEAHIVQADGTEATVKLDASFAVTGTETGHGHGGGRHDGVTETVLTGDVAAKVEAAVKAAYPDATIERMENDADGATYEAHIVQADGTEATVKLDASFAVTGTETGHGHGGGRHDADDTDADDDSATSGSTTS
jgi:uncharacterized membrane protein YkoI